MSEVQLTMKAVGKIVSDYYGVRWDDIVSQRRTADVMLPRQVAMWMARQHTRLSLPEIGRRMGGRDHTTVLYGVKKIAVKRRENPNIDQELDEIEFLISVERATYAKMGLQPSPDLDPVEIADRVFTAPNGEFSVSLPEIRTLAQAILFNLSRDEQKAEGAQRGVASLVRAIDTYAATTRLVADAKEARMRERALNDQWAAFIALTSLSETIKKELTDECTT